MRSASTTVDYVGAPAAPLLDSILAIWREVLDCAPAQLDANSNFFLEGGDSLALARVLIRVRERLGAGLDIRAPANLSTPAKMAACVRAASAFRLPRVAAERGAFSADSTERFPASEGQAALWLAEQLAEGMGLYNTAVIVHLSGALQIPVLAKAFDAVVQQHELLRCRLEFNTNAKKLEVLIDRSWQVRLDPETVLFADPRLRLRALAAQPFDLAAGPLWRFQLVNTGEQSWALLLCLHHCISDAWSGPILLRSLADSYNALLRDPQWMPPALEREFRSYCRHEQASATQEQARVTQQHASATRDLDWWRAQLAGLDRAAAWPGTGSLRWPFAMACEELLLPQASIARVQQCSAAQGLQLSAFLLTALRLALRSLTGIAEFCIGMPATMRSSSAQEQGIGYFVNLLVLRECLDPKADALTLLRQVQQGLDAALLHRGPPFPSLVRALAPAVLPSGNLWCDILFAFQNSPQPVPGFSCMIARVEALTMPYAQHPLKIEIVKASAGWTARIEYASKVFRHGEVPRLLAMFNHYIAQLALVVELE